MGRFSTCMNILETAIQSQGTCPSTITDLNTRAALFSVYRTFIECLLDIRTYNESHRQWALTVFGQMISGKSENPNSLVEIYLRSCVKGFLQTPSDENKKNIFFLSNLECDAIVCYAYYLYIRDDDIQPVIKILQNCADHFKHYSYSQVLSYYFFIVYDYCNYLL